MTLKLGASAVRLMRRTRRSLSHLLWKSESKTNERMSSSDGGGCLACNAHYHATLQHSLPLRPRQQAPGHADLRQWQCRVSVQRETATSDDNLSNLRCWRNAGAHKQSPGPLATLE